MSRGMVLALVVIISSSGEPRVRIGEPALVTQGPAGERRWGRYQFPRIFPMDDGRVLVYVHVEADAVEAYGRPGKVFVSADRGVTWAPDEGAAARPHGLRLPGGDWFRIATTPAVPVAGRALTKPAGTVKNYSLDYTMYRLRDLAPDLRLIFFDRFARGGRSWQQESTELDDPNGFRLTVGGLLPRIWWGDIRVAPGGSLVALIYLAQMKTGRTFYCDAVCYRSRDQGKTWRRQGRIRYAPDLGADPRGNQRYGFSEPALEILKDDSLLAVLRTTDGIGQGPMYLGRSRNMGKTWSTPVTFTSYGVMPRLLLLGNGTLVLSTGRPGAEVRFSFDGRGDSWTAFYPLVPRSGGNPQADSCGYTDLLPLDDSSFLVVYSWFKRPGADGAPHKAILVRRVEVAAR